MKETEREIKKYGKEIRSLLPCSRKRKKQIMAQIEANLADYRAEHPEADFSQIKAHFGPPEEIAAAYVESAGTAEILQALRVRKRLVAIVSCVTVFILVSWIAVVTVDTIRAEKDNHGFIIVETAYLPQDTIIVDGSVTITEVEK